MAHLLVVCGYWPRRSNPISGVFIVEQIQALAELGHKVTVLLLHGVGRRKDYLSLGDLGVMPDRVDLHVRTVWKSPQRISHRRSVFAIDHMATGRAVRREIRDINCRGVGIDGCVVHGLRFHGYSAPLWVEALAGAPRLCFVHGIDPVLERIGDKPWLHAAARGSSEIDHICVVGSLLLEHLAELGFGATPVARVVPNGTNLPSADAGLSPPLLAGVGGPRIILSVANLILLKGVDDTLRALAAVKADGHTDWQYRIIGDGPERSRFESLAMSLGLADQVCFLGRLSHAETLAEMGACDLFCLPSWAEAFGIVYLEAMVRGRPVIGCNNCGPADFVTDGVDGILVPPRSPRSLAKAIDLLWRDPDRVRGIAAAGRKTGRSYTWARNAETVVSLLKTNDA